MCMHLTEHQNTQGKTLKELQEKIDKLTIIMEDYTPLFLVMNRSSRQIVSKDTVERYNINKLNLIHI